MPHAILAASLVLLEKGEQARSAAQSLLQVFPGITLSSLPIEPVRPLEAKAKFYNALLSVGIPN